MGTLANLDIVNRLLLVLEARYRHEALTGHLQRIFAYVVENSASHHGRVLLLEV